jgi:sigma-B regulation protein RsbU (phosphoserine phosphatase)
MLPSAPPRRARPPRTALTDLRRALEPAASFDAAPFQVAWWSRPAEAVGGDLVVTHLLPDGRRLLLVADVMGHGTAAALVASGVRALLHLHLDANPASPSELLSRLSRSVAALYAGYFVTATACVLDPASGRLTYAQAGHPALLVREAEGDVIHLSLPSLPLGVLPGECYDEATHTLRPGAAVVIHTDGVTDALADTPTDGLVALAGMLRAGDAERLVRRVRRAMRRARQAGRPVDDCTVLAATLPAA